jgi:hypothetical protein
MQIKIYDFLLQPYVKALGEGQIGTKRLIFYSITGKLLLLI